MPKTPKRITDDIFPVGEYLVEELEARLWSNAELATRTGLSPAEIEAIIDGSQRMLVKDAEVIGRAFGSSPETWLRLQKIARRGNA